MYLLSYVSLTCCTQWWIQGGAEERLLPTGGRLVMGDLEGFWKVTFENNSSLEEHVFQFATGCTRTYPVQICLAQCNSLVHGETYSVSYGCALVLKTTVKALWVVAVVSAPWRINCSAFSPSLKQRIFIAVFWFLTLPRKSLQPYTLPASATFLMSSVRVSAIRRWCIVGVPTLESCCPPESNGALNVFRAELSRRSSWAAEELLLWSPLVGIADEALADLLAWGWDGGELAPGGPTWFECECFGLLMVEKRLTKDVCVGWNLEGVGMFVLEACRRPRKWTSHVATERDRSSAA